MLFPLSERHFVPQSSFRLQPVEFGSFADGDKQVVCRRIAVAGSSRKRAEQQDVFGDYEIVVHYMFHDSCRFGRIVFRLCCFHFSGISR